MRPRLLVATLIVAAACVPLRPVAAQTRADSSGSFEPIAAVLSSPRCANCHIAGDAPLQGDDGRLHAMRVQRGMDGRGTPAMQCTNCHQVASSQERHAPPGAPDWRLPPAATRMAWKGLRAREQCLMVKDRSRNGGKTLAQLIVHVQHDPLVVASWSPGPGRTLPPIPHDVFVSEFKAWVDRGAVCPD